MTLITEPGLYHMSLAEYLADPCPAPSLNASLAKILLTQTPEHAKLAHPRLTPVMTPQPPADHFDLGTAVHQLVLEGEVRFLEVHARDWKGKAAQADRKDARAAGLIPLLSSQLLQVRVMAEEIRRRCAMLSVSPTPLLDLGESEVVLAWTEGDFWCRARLDFLHDDHRTIDDLKTTGESAHPGEWVRRLFDRGHDVQAAFHRRGVEKVFGVRPDFRFVVAETDPPYAVSLIGLDLEALEFAEARRLRALDRWTRCLTTGKWPGYPTREVTVGLPPWIHARFIEEVYFEVEEVYYEAQDG